MMTAAGSFRFFIASPYPTFRRAYATPDSTRFPARNVGVDYLLEERERQRAVLQHFVVELAQVEPRAERALRTLAQLEDLQHADLVGERLRRHHEVTLDLDDDFRFRHAGVLHHVPDGLLARPALGMHPGIDDEAHRAEHLVLQPAEIVGRILLVPGLPGEPLSVQRPALVERGERHYPAKER